LYSDAYDVVFTGQKDTLLEKYLSFNRPIVFGAETDCSPDDWRKVEYSDEDNRVQFPYLNSGLFIGRIGALRNLMCGDSFSYYDDDQRYWTNKYLANGETIELDSKNMIFLTSIRRLNKSDIMLTASSFRYRHNMPQLVHANGHDKGFHLAPFVSFIKDQVP
jgi:hypothetical protein